MFNQTSIEDSLIPSFDLRSTMPCSFNRTSVKKTLELQQKVGKSKVETVLNTKIPSEINLNSFFVRVSHNNLEEQRRIYKWRMSCSEEFIGISSIKLQSEGNQYNPNLLFKVDMAVSKSNFVQVKDICLTKCVNLIKSVLQGISTLLEYFQPIILTDKMIYLTQQGSTKVWMDQRFYINPNNELYSKINKQVSVEESLKSVIQIFKLKCLKTKLSNQLFSTLSQSKTFKEAIQQIQSFERKQSLFPIQGLKISVSTGYALNTSVSLQFSGSKSSKKKKLIDKEIQKDYRTKNLAASSKFLQAKSMEINPSQLNSNKKIREQKMTYQSQHRIYQNEQQRIRSDGFLLQVNPEKPSNSIVISQMFQSDNQLSTIPKKEIEQQISTRSRNHTEPVLNISDRKIKQKDEDDLEQGKQQNGIDSILSKNGWNTNITSLFDRRNVKQSFAQGKQENAHLRGFQLKKLHTMGKDVRESILPVDEEDQDY